MMLHIYITELEILQLKARNKYVRVNDMFIALEVNVIHQFYVNYLKHFTYWFKLLQPIGLFFSVWFTLHTSQLLTLWPRSLNVMKHDFFFWNATSLKSSHLDRLTMKTWNMIYLSLFRPWITGRHARGFDYIYFGFQ